MKTIIFVCFVILFSSCSKEDVNWGTWDWGGFTITGDSSNKVKADVYVGGAVSHMSAVAFDAGFSRYVLTQYSDSSLTTITGNDAAFYIKLDLVNIKTPGTYSFGPNPGGRNLEVRASCTRQGPGGSISYYNNSTVRSGTITIDNLSGNHIQGTFSVTCWNGTDAANITNGSFTGNYH